MSDIIKDGGPAFSTVKLSSPGDDLLQSDTWKGMSLRTWLTGKALSGVLSNPDFIIRILNYDNPVRPSDNSQKLFDEAAAVAVRAADAVIKELNL